jgi:hypothetical protein
LKKKNTLFFFLKTKTRLIFYWLVLHFSFFCCSFWKHKEKKECFL